MDRIPLLDTPRRFIGLGVPDDNVSIDSDRIVECCPVQKSCLSSFDVVFVAARCSANERG